MRDTVQRHFCGRCGSRVFNAFHSVVGDEESELVGIFPALFDDSRDTALDHWLPTVHVHCGSAIMNVQQMQDNLPRHEGKNPAL